MKKIICMALVCFTMLMGAKAQVNIVEKNRNPRSECWEDSVKNYIEKGRRGDKTAFEKLAECYHEGKGVERNFINMVFMYLQASERGGLSMEEYMARYEVNDPDRLLFDAMNDIEQKKFDDATVKLEKLKAMNQPSSITIQAFLAAEMDKDQEKSERLLLEASEKGCSLGQLLYAKSAEERKDDTEYKKRLESITTNIPMTYNQLGRVYWEEGREIDSEELMNQAKDCFRKADEYACLMKQNARRLLYCYKKDVELGKAVCDSVELEHVQLIACVDPFSKEEIVSYEYEE